MIYLLWYLKFSGCKRLTTKSTKYFHKEHKKTENNNKTYYSSVLFGVRDALQG